MRIPGFSAEAALSYGSRAYQVVENAAIDSGTVEPATLFGTSSTVIGPPAYAICWKWRCFIGLGGRISCNYYPGMWNPSTGLCQ
jgi:hypothetical protein